MIKYLYPPFSPKTTFSRIVDLLKSIQEPETSQSRRNENIQILENICKNIKIDHEHIYAIKFTIGTSKFIVRSRFDNATLTKIKIKSLNPVNEETLKSFCAFLLREMSREEWKTMQNYVRNKMYFDSNLVCGSNDWPS